jgi:hypothetical protein
MADTEGNGRPAEIQHWPPTSWLDPIDISRTGLLTVLAGLFGSFADKRETLAALYPTDPKALVFDHSQKDDVWFDYICDTGDGWNPTYAIAYLVGQDLLTVEGANGGASIELPRGEFTILGGDQVYPVASVKTYRHRMEGPYYAARAQSHDGHNRTPVYALPGNHDWYDGLTTFIRLFCQKGRWVGQWTATQTRSYFAIQLPHRWWVWGLDVQLESDLDVPQVDYFKKCAALLQEGDRVIIVSPEPTWIEMGRTGEENINQSHKNMTYLEGLIRRKKALIPVKIAGDLHHYARYRGADGEGQLITCGGGGAFLHGTYGLPRELDLRKSTGKKFESQMFVPTENQSKALRVPVIWRLLAENRLFAAAVGGIYWLYSWLLQSASEALNTLPWDAPTFLDYVRTPPCRGDDCPGLFGAWWDIVMRSPVLFFFTLLIIGGCAAFGFVCGRAGSPRWKYIGLAILGGIHGFMHIVIALVLMFSIAQACPLNWLTHFLTGLVGGIPGAILMAIYLLLANMLFDGHDQEVLSTQAIPDYKCFARFHVTREKVTIYPIAPKTVPSKWKLAKGVKQTREPSRSFLGLRTTYYLEVAPDAVRMFEPDPEGSLRARLLEQPIEA